MPLTIGHCCSDMGSISNGAQNSLKFTDPDTLDELYLSINPKEDQGSFGVQKKCWDNNEQEKVLVPE